MDGRFIFMANEFGELELLAKAESPPVVRDSVISDTIAVYYDKRMENIPGDLFTDERLNL